MKAIHRVLEYISHEGGTKASFEKRMGFSNGYLATQLKREADLGEGVLSRIIDNSLINPVWLLTGEGEMLRGQGLTTDCERCQALELEINRLNKIIDAILDNREVQKKTG